VDRVLAGQAVGDQQCLVGANLVAHGLELDHKLIVDMQAAGGIEDDDVDTFPLRGLLGTRGDIHGLLTEHDRQAVDAGLIGEHLELLLGGGTLHVEGRKQDLFALPGLQSMGDLGRCRGLTGALEADHQQDLRRRTIEVQLDRLTAKELDQVIIDDLDHHLTRGDRLQHLLADRAFLDASDEVLDHRQRHIGFEQCDPNVAHRLFDVFFRERAPALQLFEDIAETVGEIVEHAVGPGIAACGKGQSCSGHRNPYTITSRIAPRQRQARPRWGHATA